MKRISILLLIAAILMPSTGCCDEQTDTKLANAIEKLKALKPDDVQFLAITTEGGKVIIEGYANTNAAIAGLLKSITENNIGAHGIREMSPVESEGRHVSHFIVWVKIVDVAEPPRPTADGILRSIANEPSPFVILHKDGDMAWWFGAEFHPFGKDIRGIPIKTIDASWCAANEFKKALFPREVVEGVLGLNEIMGDKDSFSLAGKFDGARQLTALVGVFETCDKKTATFLLLLDTKNKENPVVSLIKYDTPFFAYLLPDEKGFLLLDCYACSEATLYQWDKKSRNLIGTNLGEGD